MSNASTEITSQGRTGLSRGGAGSTIGKLGLWAARSLSILGAILSIGGLLIAGLTPPSSGPSDAALSGMLLVLGVGLFFAGLITLGLGELFQKMKHDEWSLGGYRFPRGPQVKCMRCGGLMNADSRVCPFCGAEVGVEPLTWSKGDPSDGSKPQGA
jgi:hypothetical protein